MKKAFTKKQIEFQIRDELNPFHLADLIGEQRGGFELKSKWNIKSSRRVYKGSIQIVFAGGRTKKGCQKGDL